MDCKIQALPYYPYLVSGPKNESSRDKNCYVYCGAGSREQDMKNVRMMEKAENVSRDKIVQNQLVKRGATRNTHVVACDESERTACARKWRIPVVDPSWIIESIIKVNENQRDEDFRFDEKPLKNYIRNDELWLVLCHSLERRSRELSQRESISPKAAPLCTTARSSSDDCVIVEDGNSKNRMIREDERKCEEDDVCIIEAPVNSRLEEMDPKKEFLFCFRNKTIGSAVGSSSVRFDGESEKKEKK
uniref:BRCT domain-containing protein n=1 Tax=Parascaris equorum TaxID=6256 RepID=A0A914RUD0_PAREQ